MPEATLYRSSNLKLFHHIPWDSRYDVLVVCFQYMQSEPDLDLPGFAGEFFQKHKIDAIYVNCATNEWFQYPDLPQALALLQSLASHWSRIVTYGSSMGAYAALRFAPAINAQCSIAVGPQFSPRSTVVPGEHRYDAMIAQTAFLYEDTHQASSSVNNYLIYDPLLTIDKRHVMAYSNVARVIPIPIPCGGHTPLIPLVQCGLHRDFLLQIIAGTFSASSFRRQFRQVRRSSSEYWRQLAEHLIDHRRTETAKRVVKFAEMQQDLRSHNEPTA